MSLKQLSWVQPGAKRQISGVYSWNTMKEEEVQYGNQTSIRENLTNRFHFAVRLYSDNAQMTSKRGEKKEVRYEPQASSLTDVLTMF